MTRYQTLTPDRARQYIKDTINLQGLSQAKFSKQIGWHRSRLAQYLNGHVDIPARHLLALFDALGVTVQLTRQDLFNQPPLEEEE